MLARLRGHLTYANVMATLAIFIALGGSSYAALRITSRNVPKDALTGADIKRLTGRDVINNSLTGADVKGLKSVDVANGALLAEDFAPGQLPRGVKGDKGETGAPGTALAYGYVRSDGSLDYARSKNITATIKGQSPFPTGYYCVDVAVPVSKANNVVATLQDGAVGHITATISTAATACPTFPHDIFFNTTNAAGNDTDLQFAFVVN
jgi:hypothetical protein